MDLANANAEVYIPDQLVAPSALVRTTHLAIGAHQDDLEIMAVDGILRCFQKDDRWFTGVIVADGSGSPRAGVYAEYTDAQMMAVREREQKKAAFIGDYAAQILLKYPSAVVKDPTAVEPVRDLVEILMATSPEIVYTHNLADKHPTHVAVAVRTLQAIRQLPADARPRKLYGCEVWRGLDWMLDEEKVAFDTSAQINLQEALLGVFDSQISGGKRYDLATMGRRLANATYYESHGVDVTTHLSLAMDLTPLVRDPDLDIRDYVSGYIQRFADSVRSSLDGMLSS